ncbi:hypothetical protein AWB92_22440 [Mycobacterium sp. IEC1808]|uniref:amidohydrolase family protein n=1 Tax=Mycobacterium sp. IEC1808 TaxID=1743230 RepID=UPI000A167B1D|nr:amidohydrolase family protein [Mycobacterium sp. IEC1808]ORW88888.1 hypothetical protein AWB92_22440 [Mycobacterium sp. IEC1808]
MKFVLHGSVVTMNAAFDTWPNGAVYIDGNQIVWAGDRGAAAPPGFAGAPVVETGGFIFPGLIELHNHLSYDALPMWQVPKLYTNRGQWQNDTDYVRSVSAPMTTIANSKDPHLLAAVARYAETKCLLGGVTTSEGISLKSDQLQAYYHGALRAVDDPNDAAFHRATTHIPDVEASQWAQFKKEVDKASCLLLHLSEGLDDEARNAFLALNNGTQWAIGPALAGIHCAALKPQDFAVLAQNGASMVWSPLSNLLLYGGTADVKSARAAGVPVALGSDWSPSGSKNLLNELKVAKIVNEIGQIGLSDRDIVAMATSAPAAIVKWGALIGSIEPSKRADVTVIAAASSADPYAALIDAKETDVVLVLVDGRPVIGTKDLMSGFGVTGEALALGTDTRVVHYGPPDPKVPPITFADARAALTDALQRLPTLLADENRGQGVAGRSLTAAAEPEMRLALDEEHLSGFALRPSLPLAGQQTGPDARLPALAAAPLPPKSLSLDPVCVAVDAAYGDGLQGQLNLPAEVKQALKAYY